MTMDHLEVGRIWEANAEAWTVMSRAGYDRCPRPLQELLAFGVSGQLEPEHECRDRVPSVYLLPGEGSMLEAHRAPLFSGQGSP